MKNGPAPMQSLRFHYIFDALGIREAKLADAALVERLLRELAELCGMRILSGPHVAHGVPENPGISGFCIIDYSHISIHTFSETGEIYADIFSCKPYDPERVRRHLMVALGADGGRVTFFRVEYPLRGPSAVNF
ncbi:MAG: S-adenosylmethionine decarboxylase [Candidatus Colwellbacteria bacterium]|nr:S-adenosylmethionine decarboxylase [Candidatus Colwellbacteria bacterium]